MTAVALVKVLQASKKWTCYFPQCSVVDSGEVKSADLELKGTTMVVQRRQEVPLVGVDHIHDVQELEEPVAAVKREVAYSDLRVFHVLSMKYSDVLYVLVLVSVVHLAHNSVAGYNMEDQKVVADVLGKRAQQVEDVMMMMMEGRALDSRRGAMGFVRMAMRYSARKGVAVVLDP